MSDSTLNNSNILSDLQCPDCKNTERFSIYGHSWFNVEDDGAEQYGDIYWEETDPMVCCDCGLNDASKIKTVSYFRTIPDNLDYPMLVTEDGNLSRVECSKPGRLTVSDIEDRLGGRYEFVTSFQDSRFHMISLEGVVSDAYAMNAKVNARFDVNVRGPILIVPKGMVS